MFNTYNKSLNVTRQITVLAKFIKEFRIDRNDLCITINLFLL